LRIAGPTMVQSHPKAIFHSRWDLRNILINPKNSLKRSK
jgi:hypothetical protein